MSKAVVKYILVAVNLTALLVLFLISINQRKKLNENSKIIQDLECKNINLNYSLIRSNELLQARSRKLAESYDLYVHYSDSISLILNNSNNRYNRMISDLTKHTNDELRKIAANQ